MNITKYVSDKMNDCHEYYPYEWFDGCKLLLKQINDGLIVDTAEKIALKEYSAIFKVTAKAAYSCLLVLPFDSIGTCGCCYFCFITSHITYSAKKILKNNKTTCGNIVSRLFLYKNNGDKLSCNKDSLSPQFLILLFNYKNCKGEQL